MNNSVQVLTLWQPSQTAFGIKHHLRKVLSRLQPSFENEKGRRLSTNTHHMTHVCIHRVQYTHIEPDNHIQRNHEVHFQGPGLDGGRMARHRQTIQPGPNSGRIDET